MLQSVGLQRVGHDLVTEQHGCMHGCMDVCTYIYISTSFQFRPYYLLYGFTILL